MSIDAATNNDSLLNTQSKRESNARSYPRRIPIAIDRAEGINVTDMNGNTYYDCLAGAGTLALGHNHPVVVEAMKRVLDEQTPLHTLDITTPTKEHFVSELFSNLPERFASKAKVQFCGPTGGDAIEAALKLVKTATGKRSILTFHGGYHGSTHATMSISGTRGPKEKVNSLMPDAYFMPYPYKYRCPFGLRGEQTHQISSQFIENMLDDPESGILPPAAMILEIVQGEGGSIPADIEWVKEMRRITKERGIPLIIDEIQTGIGRTGKFFAFEHADIVPDVIVLSKAIGGSLPLSVVVYDESLDQWEPGAHIGTFRGNQLAMAAGTATMKYIKEHNLTLHAAEMGERLMRSLSKVQEYTPEIGEVRGRGLMIGVEMVQPDLNRSKNGSHPANPKLAGKIQAECLKRGLIVEVGGRHGCVIRILPPLIITKEQIDEVTSILKNSIKKAKLAEVSE
ncbi:diaminobutyrate--2-oxoglutarate transaminase [Halobacillus andaensis]|uniref:Diaminobutyrate--2-oxoglutarate transaminase n=1 Tax=Halobacillus andaensis TaxID=1176239 RepID=A0A917BAF1_HALAA|nr:aspartate aminotransferase family protein [Halobacillus andaensis]MBP2005508.1 diaminobutyrate-2-oxoglutarate transaminase [Halobacillus andaensis]GGF32040.1 diaminobutyrate--2-oxoglutarate transaminase [Halobacillus andaensis]